MKKYKVSFYYEESGYTVVRANSKKKAEKKAKEHLADKGLDGLDYDCKNREYDTVAVEEIK